MLKEKCQVIFDGIDLDILDLTRERKLDAILSHMAREGWIQ